MMNKIQRVRFAGVGDFLDSLQPSELQMTEMLREIIFDTIPDISERLSYNVPFYYRYKRICYIWPASVPWGGLKPGEGVALGFCQGNLIRHGGYLSEGQRRQIAVRIFHSVSEINPSILAGLLDEATRIDSGRTRGNK